MDKVAIFLLTVLGVMAFAWIIQGIRLYKSCKGDLYGTLFGGFLPYFYRYVVLRDCSESGYLRSQIGEHRLVFTMVNNKDGQKTRFCVIFYSRGIMVLCYDRSEGQFRGSTDGKNLSVTRVGADGRDHIYRHPCPTADLRAYAARLAGVFPGVHLETRLAFRDEADISQLTGSVKAIRFCEVEEELKSVQAGIIPDDEITAMYRKLIR